MPTTAVGLLIFIVLLAPGLTWVGYRSASRPVTKPTALRELGTIALVSVIWDVLALLLFGIVRVILPTHTPDVGALLRDSHRYLTAHGPYVFWWVAGLLAATCAAALTTARVAHSELGSTILELGPVKAQQPTGSVTTSPAWWLMFQDQPPDNTRVYVGVNLDDGTYLGGYLLSYSPNSDETADRDLVLSGTIDYVSADGKEKRADLGVGAVIVSAHHIKYLTVSYVATPPTP